MQTNTNLPHVAIFPFLSKGHIITLLIHLANALRRRRRLAAVTLFTTPLNASFIRRSLNTAEVVELPFPADDRVPPGVESTNQLPSISLFVPFVAAVKLLRPQFERALEASPTPFDLLISDAFLSWTNESTNKLAIPRLVFYGMGGFSMTTSALIFHYKPHASVSSPHEPFVVPGFPRPTSFLPSTSRIRRANCTTASSSRIFWPLKLVRDSSEAAYLERWNSELGPKAWCVGPLCLAGKPPDERTDRSGWFVQWLDARSDAGRPVLYVAFGSQAELSTTQLKELAVGLERTGLDFVWVLKAKDPPLPEGFEERVQGRGLVVREWVDQLGTLRHAAVEGFMSHCGWNSVSAGVPILAWPMIAEQKINAKFVVEELKMGLWVRTNDGTLDGLVKAEDVERLVKEILVGEKGKEAKRKAGELAAAATRSLDGDGGGSSKRMLEEVCSQKN